MQNSDWIYLPVNFPVTAPSHQKYNFIGKCGICVYHLFKLQPFSCTKLNILQKKIAFHYEFKMFTGISPCTRDSFRGG